MTVVVGARRQSLAGSDILRSSKNDLPSVRSLARARTGQTQRKCLRVPPPSFWSICNINFRVCVSEVRSCQVVRIDCPLRVPPGQSVSQPIPLLVCSYDRVARGKWTWTCRPDYPVSCNTASPTWFSEVTGGMEQKRCRLNPSNLQNLYHCHTPGLLCMNCENKQSSCPWCHRCCEKLFARAKSCGVGFAGDDFKYFGRLLQKIC